MRQKRHKFELRRRVELESDLFESQAFRSLSGKASWVLMRFHQKRRWETFKYGGHKQRTWENGGLSFTYSEAMHFGISRRWFHKIISELIRKGFIEVEHQGGWTGKDPSSYRLVDTWRQSSKTE